MSGSTSDGAGTSTSSDQPNPAQFECNICLDVAKDAVVSYCGHLFCWPCLHEWLETRPNKQECPVCKAGIGKDKVVPLYGRGSASNIDPRDKMPPRPQAQRPEVTDNGSWSGFNMGNGVQMSFGVGAFPFGFFGATFNNHHGLRRTPQPGTPDQQDELILSRAFLWVAVILIFWLFAS